MFVSVVERELFDLGTLILYPVAKTWSHDVTQILVFPGSPMLSVLMFPANIPPHF